MERYEDEMVRRYAAQQQQRMDELSALKAQAEEAREKIFMKLKEEEDARRAEEEFKENLRTSSTWRRQRLQLGRRNEQKLKSGSECARNCKQRRTSS